MSYTLRGRLESRLAVALVPFVIAAGLSALMRDWWPVELAALMVGVGVALDAFLYHRVLPYQPGWVAVPTGLLELGILMGLVQVLGIGAPLGGALALFAGSWSLAQLLGHAAFPLLYLSYGEDGGELGRFGIVAALALATVLAGAGGVAWGTRPPTIRLDAGVHQGPLVLDHSQILVGGPGAIVRGGIVVTADDVTVRGLTIVGGEIGIEVDGAEGVVVEDVAISGFSLDGIQVRRGQAHISDCLVESLDAEYGQGIDISFGFDLAPSLVEDCTVVGGREGIVTHFAHARVSDNRVSGTSLRALTLTEMSMAVVEGNDVSDSLGVGIFCGDYSECEIDDNSVDGIRPDDASGDKTRMGFAILAHYGAKAVIGDNHVSNSPGGTDAVLGAEISAGE
jgi:hypothetical protein